MKEKGIETYLFIMYISVTLIGLAIDVFAFGHTLSIDGIVAQLISSVLDLFFVFLIGYGVDAVLKRLTKSTLVPNIVITLLIYEGLMFWLKNLAFS